MNPIARNIKVGLELTSKCNLRCGMCPLPVLRRPYEDMPWPLVERAEKEIHGNGLKLKWLHEMGEPLRREFEVKGGRAVDLGTVVLKGFPVPVCVCELSWSEAI